MVNQHHPLIRLANSSDVQAKSRFVEMARRMEVSELSEFYQTGLENAPKRWAAKKRYFVRHDGRPSTPKPTAFGLTTSEVPSRLLVIAPTDYWDSFRGNRATVGWESAMQDLARKINQATKVDVDFLELEGFDFTVGHEGTTPKITTVGVCRRAV